MKLLIITQKVDQNDDVLGFFHYWIAEFAKQADFVTAICLYQGKYNFADNVKVLSLGKEDKESTIKYLFRFFKYILIERRNYDSVLVHMNAEYVLLGGWLWRILGKKIGLWYAHGAVNWKLRLAEKICHYIFTSTKEGCRLVSNKINIVGQGIDVDKFSPSSNRFVNEKFKIVTIGRISPVKKYEIIIEAAKILKNKLDFSVEIIGAAGLADQNKYLYELKKAVIDNGLAEQVRFVGSVANDKIVSYLQTADIFVNASQTGSLDKAILEAMACEVPVLTCNDALRDILAPFGEQLLFEHGQVGELADKLVAIANMSPLEKQALGSKLRQIVCLSHGVKELVAKILEIIK